MHIASSLRVALLALLWGSGFLWIKISLRSLAPGQIVVTRLLLAALVLIVVLHLIGGRLPRNHITWLHLTVAATFGNVIPYLLFAIGLQQVDSAVGGMLNATTPLWTVIIALTASQHIRLSPIGIIGLVIGLAGTVLIFAPWNVESQFTSRGAIACLLGAFSYGISYAYIARFLARRGANALALPAGQLMAASGLSLLIVIPFNGLNVTAWRLDAIVSVTTLGVLGTGLAYVLNYRIIADDGPVAASSVIYLLPVVAVALGTLFLSEQPAAHSLLGSLIVLLGIAMIHHSVNRPLSASLER